jgi:hypothetical protein
MRFLMELDTDRRNPDNNLYQETHAAPAHDHNVYRGGTKEMTALAGKAGRHYT